MFELKVAYKYLLPRWRQLSVSIISFISIIVIALVVWLILVFFSITNGLEKNWIEKLVALTAPIRVTPTKAYFDSYYYQIDAIAEASDYNYKTIGEKLAALNTDPYDPAFDQEIPTLFKEPDLNPDGTLKDLVKLAFQAASQVQRVPVGVSDFEITYSQLHLDLFRKEEMGSEKNLPLEQLQLNQVGYLSSIDPKNPSLKKNLVPKRASDFENMLISLSLLTQNSKKHDLKAYHEGLRHLFQNASVEELTTSSQGPVLPLEFLASKGRWKALLLKQGNRPESIVIPSSQARLKESEKKWRSLGFSTTEGEVLHQNGKIHFKSETLEKAVDLKVSPIRLDSETPLRAHLVKGSLSKSEKPSDILFEVDDQIQGISFKKISPLKSFKISRVKFHSPDEKELLPLWVYESKGEITFPYFEALGDGVLLPKQFRENGVLVGDRGFLSYFSQTSTRPEEQRLPIFVAGFYDPGVIPIGGKFVLANKEITSLVRKSLASMNDLNSTGISLHFSDYNQAEPIKGELVKNFDKLGILPYWNIQTFREFDFTHDLLQQLHSEKNVFSLISAVILIVACSNIVSMLIILVNDKKMEIGILRAMGASSFSIALIFGLCGVIMGLIGSLFGIFLAVITLKNLNFLIDLMTWIQGHQVFNPTFFGDVMPNELSFEALLLVVGMTALVSTLAGVVPAVKASLIRPSNILRSE